MFFFNLEMNSRRMEKSESRTTIIVTVITVVGGIIVAIINLNPFSDKKKIEDSSPPSVYTKQNKILSGTVVDGSTNSSIPQAFVSIVGRNENYTTQDDGNFRISFADSTLDEVRV